MHGSFTGGNFRESSPFITRHRKLDNHPLCINNNDSESIGEEFKNGTNYDDQEPSIRQIALVEPMMVKRKGILSSINSSCEDIGKL